MNIHFIISLLITGLLSIVMLLVLGALLRAGVPGIRQWIAANGAAALALPLFALRDTIPDVLSIQLANALLLSASALMLTGYFSYFGRAIPRAVIWAAVVLTWAMMTICHYGWDSLPARVVIASIFHGGVCVAIAWLVSATSRNRKRSYIEQFVIGSALALAFGHAVRLVVYAAQLPHQMSFFDTSLWNTAFLAFGTLVMPMLTMGSVLIVYDGLVTRAVDRANRDFLTGAWSRRAFFDLAKRERASALRHGSPMSLIVFDVDHFKRINDTLGHGAGDRVLTEIVRRVGHIIRQIDYCARIGGEEFAVLLPNTQSTQAHAVAVRLRTAMYNEPFQVASSNAAAGSIQVSISIGVATMHGTQETVAQLLRRCDAALYEAKRAGRNCIVEAVPPEEASVEDDAAVHEMHNASKLP